MPVSTKAIKGRIKSVANTKKITKAMEMVAASKMRKAVERSLASREFAKRALELLVAIAGDRLLQHPLLREGEGQKTLLIIMASNKGLCGSFNVSVFKELKQYIDNHDEEIHAITVGKYAERFARKMNLHVKGSFIEFPDTVTPDDIRGLTRLVLEEYETSEYRRVRCVFTNFISAMSSQVEIRGLLPVTKDHLLQSIADTGSLQSQEETKLDSMQLYTFEPSEDAVLEYILPILTEVQIYQSLLESNASEHSSRMVAMKSASENASDMIDSLTLTYNKARQASITQEIIEIATGAEALQ
ncbi:MAG: ATP synthase F1 subunit gamma [Patescibacteria group bacterium]